MTDPLAIRHRITRETGETFLSASQRVVGRCVWCGEECWTMALTPFRPDLGQVPLHLFCGSDMRSAYRAWRDGVAMTPEMSAGLRRLGEWATAAQLRLKEGTMETKCPECGVLGDHHPDCPDIQPRDTQAAAPSPFPSPFAKCPFCGSGAVARMKDDWQDVVDVREDPSGVLTANVAVPIVGCGNPWHYTTSLGDAPVCHDPNCTVPGHRS